MARIRSIKPEFWTSEQIMELSIPARLAFIGLWNHCDDRGVHPASAKTLKAQLFPSDDMTADVVAGLIAEMMQQGLVVEFEADGKRYWHVTGWARHQKIDKPTFRYPAPPTSHTNPRALADASPNPRLPFAEASTTERSGDESKGVEEETSGNCMPALESEERTSPPALPDGRTYPLKASPPAEQTREQAIAVWLRKAEKDRGKFVTAPSSDTRIQAWAEHSVTDAQLTEAYELAVADRTKTGDAGPINPGFLDIFVAKVLTPNVGTSVVNRLPATHALAWALAWSGIVAKGNELGLTQGDTEQNQAFKARVYAAAGITQTDVDKLRADLPTPRLQVA